MYLTNKFYMRRYIILCYAIMRCDVSNASPDKGSKRLDLFALDTKVSRGKLRLPIDTPPLSKPLAVSRAVSPK